MTLHEIWQALLRDGPTRALAGAARQRGSVLSLPEAAPGAAGALSHGPEARLRFRAWRLSLAFLLVCCVAVAAVNGLFAYALSQSVSREALERDADFMIKYVLGIALIEEMEDGLGGQASLGEILDERKDPARLGVSPQLAALRRSEFVGHMLTLPDTLRVNLIGRDKVIFWSTDPKRIGRRNDVNVSLDAALAQRRPVTDGYWRPNREEQKDAIGNEHQGFFVESYIPLLDRQGEVATVVEVYREPSSIIANVARIRSLVWIGTAAATLVVCLVLILIMRSFDRLVRAHQRRRMENERLILVGEMSAAVAHGLRSPLAAIRSSAELAGQSHPERARQHAGDIIARVDELNAWLRELLTFSQPAAASQAEAVRLNELLCDALRTFARQAAAAGVEMDCSACAEPLPPVAGDPRLILQVLNSLITNALEAMPRGGMLLVAGEAASGRQVRLAIRDTGVGMSPRQLERLFQPFQTSKGNGLGLGMALAKRIMENAGGGIQVRSREGEGTEVVLTFQAAQ